MHYGDSAHRSTLLDNWRGWAIIFVLAGHFLHVPGVDPGRLGVELFFVLSGRLMADLLFVKRTPIPTFFYRRFTRVFPISLLFIFAAWISFPPGTLFLGTKQALVSAAMLVNYTQLVGLSAAVTDHYWSLCVEEHSYLVLAILAFLLRRSNADTGPRPGYVCLGLAALMILNGFRLWHANHDYYMTYWRSDVRAAAIFLSVGLRILSVNDKLLFSRHSWFALAAFVCGFLLNTGHVPDPVKYSLGSLCIAASVNSLEHAHATAQKFLSIRVIAWMGVISYSLYIWQQPFFYSKDHYGAIPMLAMAIAVGCAGFYLVENPVREKLNSLRRNRATPVPPTHVDSVIPGA
jgi:peptidoglycan/LPS O-acetylase OafA/YrhL